MKKAKSKGKKEVKAPYGISIVRFGITYLILMGALMLQEGRSKIPPPNPFICPIRQPYSVIISQPFTRSLFIGAFIPTFKTQ